MNHRFACSVAFVFLSSYLCQARFVYLAPTGNDVTTGGLSGQPWKTITYATGRMTAGDTLLVTAGTYTAETRIDISNGGTVSAPMVIKAQTATRPVIDLGYIRPPADLPLADSTDEDVGRSLFYCFSYLFATQVLRSLHCVYDCTGGNAEVSGYFHECVAVPGARNEAEPGTCGGCSRESPARKGCLDVYTITLGCVFGDIVE